MGSGEGHNYLGILCPKVRAMFVRNYYTVVFVCVCVCVCGVCSGGSTIALGGAAAPIIKLPPPFTLRRTHKHYG